MLMAAQIILHIPHASDYIPCMDGYLVDRGQLFNEIMHLTDWYTDDLFDLQFPKIIAQFSRVFCDVERFADDSAEVMSQCGMGMCYTHFDDGRLMRVVTPELRERIKKNYYDPHHRQLEKLVDESLANHGKALIIDCHSFPDIPLERDLQKNLPRPDFCIGTNDFHTPPSIAGYAYEYFANKGYDVRFNDPYSGTVIPKKFYRTERNVCGIMIEVNRKLYMHHDQNGISRSSDYKKISILIKEFLKDFSSQTHPLRTDHRLIV